MRGVRAFACVVAAATCVVAGACIAASVAPLERIATIAMPGVKGRIDHFSADAAQHRIFVAALGNDTVEVIDTEHNTRRSIAGLAEPQGVLYVPDGGVLFIANGRGARVDIVDAATLATRRRIEGLDDADNVRYDARAHRVVVGYGAGALRAMDATGESAGDIALPGHPESFQLERNGDRAFVNVPTARAVVVVDRIKRATLATWPTAGVGANFPMALDEASGRLFVGARSPPTLLVYDIASGKIVARIAIGGDTDDLFFDAVRKRLYVVCGEGRIDVIGQQSPHRYAVETSIATAPRARTGLYVAEESRLYVAAPASGGTPARILVYRVQ